MAERLTILQCRLMYFYTWLGHKLRRRRIRTFNNSYLWVPYISVNFPAPIISRDNLPVTCFGIHLIGIDWVRTSNRMFRRHVHYPVMLRSHITQRVTNRTHSHSFAATVWACPYNHFSLIYWNCRSSILLVGLCKCAFLRKDSNPHFKNQNLACYHYTTEE